MNKMLAKDEVKKEQLHLARLLGKKKTKQLFLVESSGGG